MHLFNDRIRPSFSWAVFAGDVLVTLREGALSIHNRDRLMHVAFNGIGGFPMAKINAARQEAAIQVRSARGAIQVRSARGAIQMRSPSLGRRGDPGEIPLSGQKGRSR